MGDRPVELVDALLGELAPFCDAVREPVELVLDEAEDLLVELGICQSQDDGG